MLPIRNYTTTEIQSLESTYITKGCMLLPTSDCQALAQDINDAKFYNNLFSSPRNCSKATEYINKYVVPTLTNHLDNDTSINQTYLHDLFSAYLYWAYHCASNTEISNIVSNVKFRNQTEYDSAYSAILQDARPFESPSATKQKLSADSILINSIFSNTFNTIDFKPNFLNTSTFYRALYVLYLMKINQIPDSSVFLDKDRVFLTYLFATYPGLYSLKFKGATRYWFDFVRPNTPNAIRFPSNSEYSKRILEQAPQVIQYIKNKHSNVLREKIKTPEEMQAFVNDVGLTFQIPIGVQVDTISRYFPQTEGDSQRVIVGFSQSPSVFTNVADLFPNRSTSTDLTNVKDINSTLLTAATNLATTDFPKEEPPKEEPPKEEPPKEDTTSSQFTSGNDTKPWYKTGVGISLIVLGVGGVGVGAYLLTKTKKPSI